MNVSPNDVDRYDELERYIVRRMHQENYNTMSKAGYQIPIGSKVNVFNERNAMAKRRSDIEPGNWVVSKNDGVLFEIKNEHGDKQIKSRYQLKPVWN